jgi:hypothetical protein
VRNLLRVSTKRWNLKEVIHVWVVALGANEENVIAVLGEAEAGVISAGRQNYLGLTVGGYVTHPYTAHAILCHNMNNIFPLG